jgi:hypothetical protein
VRKYEAILTKIQSTHNNIRTNSMRCQCSYLPEVGVDFKIFGDSLEVTGDTRAISTTTVQTVSSYGDNVGNNWIEFTTTNSRYKLEILNECN